MGVRVSVISKEKRVKGEGVSKGDKQRGKV